MQRLLISACLTGEKCRYDGKDNLLPCLESLKQQYELVPVCPEVMGGLDTPRIPCERQGEKVMNRVHQDKTQAFILGAQITLDIALKMNISQALFKERSPSCGVHTIYDGTFSNRLIPGQGLCVKMLVENGIMVYSEQEVALLLGVEDNGI